MPLPVLEKKPNIKDPFVRNEIYNLTLKTYVYTNQYVYTQQEIANAYHTSRRTVGRIVIECDAQDYVTPKTKEQKNAEFLKQHGGAETPS